MLDLQSTASLRNFNRGWNLRDADAAVEHYADDATFQDPLTPEPIAGKEHVRDYLAGLFDAFPDFHVETERAVLAGQEVVYLQRCWATMSGSLQLPDGQWVEPTNRRFRGEYAVDVRLDREGRIERVRVYGDGGAILRQLGIGP